jgi:hypothetical protein
VIPKISKNQQLEVMTFRLEVVSTVPGSQAAAASEPQGLGDGNWSGGRPIAQGLFVVKNRLPPSLEQLPPEPLLTEEDTQP